MVMNKKVWLFSLFLCLGIFGIVPYSSMALEVDEKLTLRILKVSDSKKTVLINRGVEDGLVVGNHAKFYLTSGMVARGVVVKVSPSRSVWSLYRIINSSMIKNDQVMNLKISTAVKLTEDPSKSMEGASMDKTPSGKDAPIPLAEGANDLDKAGALSLDDRKELESLHGSESYAPLTSKLWEVWGALNLYSLSKSNTVSTTSTSSTTTDTDGSSTSLDFVLALEKYFLRSSWFYKFSFYPFIHLLKRNATSASGHKINSSMTGYGVGTNYHFYREPHSVHQLIGFANVTLGLGSVSEDFEFHTGTTSVSSSNLSLSGSSFFFSLGLGAKYLTSSGWGGRILLDYYRNSFKFSEDANGDTYTSILSGLRVFFGLSWRWF